MTGGKNRIQCDLESNPIDAYRCDLRQDLRGKGDKRVSPQYLLSAYVYIAFGAYHCLYILPPDLLA